MKNASRSLEQIHIGLLITSVLTLLVFLHGLNGGFQFDDFVNIVNNRFLQQPARSLDQWIAIALSSGSGALRRPISMLSFGLNVACFGMSPLAFKAGNVAIHLLNFGLVYALGWRVASHLIQVREENNTNSSKVVGLFAAAIWVLHPVNVGSVIYVVQRMNELATFFTLAGLLCYADGRERMLRGTNALPIALAGLTGFGILAILSKENGALVFAYALVIEVACYQFRVRALGQNYLLKAFFCLFIALPVAVFAAYLALHPQWLLGSYTIRDFTLYQRLLSEARIICNYLLWIFVPIPAWLGLFHDDIATSTGLFHPITTFASILFLAALILVAWMLRKRTPGLIFGVTWFLVGHSMESTILPLELVFEHRNYLPMAGLLWGAASTVTPLASTRIHHRWLVAGSVTLLAALASVSTARAIHWGSSALDFALTEVQHHPNSSRAQYEAGRAIIINGITMGVRDSAELKALPYFERSAGLDHNQVYPLANQILIQAHIGKVPATILADLADRLRRSPTYVQANPFLDMLVAASEGELSLTPQDFSTLVNAALENPHFTAAIRAMILNNYGAYLFNVAHDSQSAITLTLAAASQDPLNPYFQINLTKMALALGEPEQALTHLTLATRLNKAGVYDQEIAGLTQQLTSLKR